MTNDDRRRGPSRTELAQQAVKKALYLSDDLHELEDSNQRALLRGTIFCRDIPESRYLLAAIERAKDIARAEVER
ncbi:hypothetical protein [Streptomyces bicolor]|uniref:hypothetical protein n=1 Tax=Streptomyces bicolor TaxID=66874 RepID=UPI0004E18566|nr:hypothetical protein [Streptomyces bicolor]